MAWVIDFEVSAIDSEKKHQTNFDFFPVGDLLKQATERQNQRV
jgi:hypothetical protein